MLRLQLRALALAAGFGCCPAPGPVPDAAAEAADEGTSAPDVADTREWEAVDPCCVYPGEFPIGTVRCDERFPECPPGFPYCCTISCGCTLSYEETGCCRDLSCGAGICIETIEGSDRSFCIIGPEYACPAEKPFCCTRGAGLTYCADHELHGWRCFTL
ncbi:MAG: hypothetical protein HY905_24910 [Deltaproteobacteria bacterium]|nr:hypothetical protein [Deltaproteobacteria bacterium]